MPEQTHEQLAESEVDRQRIEQSFRDLGLSTDDDRARFAAMAEQAYVSVVQVTISDTSTPRFM
jgi:hypothetical protein